MAKKTFLAVLVLTLALFGVSRTEVGAQTIQRSIWRVGRLLVGDGSASAPSIAFVSQPAAGWYHAAANTIDYGVGGVQYAQFNGNNLNLLRDNSILNFGVSADTALSRNAAGKITLTGTTPMLQLGGTTSSFTALKSNGAQMQVRLADDSNDGGLRVGTLTLGSQIASTTGILIGVAAPTISSGFGTSPTVPTNNGQASFTVNVGTGATASSGVIALGQTSANGWNCDVVMENQIPTTMTKQSASTTSTVTVTNYTVSTGAVVAWAASQILNVRCLGR